MFYTYSTRRFLSQIRKDRGLPVMAEVKKCACSDINRGDMTMHGENIGSRKVEPVMQDLPKWRLYANFLLRELARMWYGQKSIFDLRYGYGPGSQFWRDFVFLFDRMVVFFGEEQNLDVSDMDKRLREAIRGWRIWHGMDPVFSQPYFEGKWRAIQRLGGELVQKLFDDFDVGVILSLAGYAYCFARKGKMPPYKPFARLEALEYYEALPVDPGLEDRYYNDEPLPF
jgi:hypothetical protein